MPTPPVPAPRPIELDAIMQLVIQLQIDGASRRHIAASLLSICIAALMEEGFDENATATLTRDVIHLAYSTRPEGHH